MVNNAWNNDWQEHFPNDETEIENEQNEPRNIHSENAVQIS